MTLRVLIAALIGLALALGLQSYRLVGEQRDHSETREAWAKDRAAREAAARAAEADYRARESDLQARLLEVTHDANVEVERYRSDADASARAGERLRQQLAALTARSCSPAATAAVAGGGQAAQSALDLLADVQRRLDEATDDIGRYADAASTAGRACERAYGAARAALTATPQP